MTILGKYTREIVEKCWSVRIMNGPQHDRGIPEVDRNVQIRYEVTLHSRINENVVHVKMNPTTI